ncbi:pollen-specific leucine-rich repeat extensin-like protein 1 [Helianthus annuus]|uniref:pollen-specific leucine-rich repeat extensin-like protein 1 n=1 Tax=Helianthus annuus TaxID=4232 RepID=UPI001652BFBF|nr:pollen-specific leucine-rich repeat extensin-like protein 1 [Helianthus annuus]
MALGFQCPSWNTKAWEAKLRDLGGNPVELPTKSAVEEPAKVPDASASKDAGGDAGTHAGENAGGEDVADDAERNAEEDAGGDVVVKEGAYVMPSSGTGESDTTDPMPIVSDDIVSSEHEVYTSDTTSMDDHDFQPFALPDVVAEPADGPIAGDLPLVVIPAPVPLATYPIVDMPLDVVADDDVDLFEEDDLEGEAHIAAGDLLLLADAPAEEAPDHSPGVQHHSHDTDPAPAPSFVFDHDIDDDSDPVFPPSFDPDHDIEFVHLDQPMEDPVAPVDPVFADPADFEMEFIDPEPATAPEPVVAPEPAFEHDPIHVDVPVVAPLVNDVPVDDAPVFAPPIVGLPIEAPPLVDDHAAIAHIDAPHVADIPANPVVAPLPDPVHVQFDHAPFTTHVDPRYAHTRNGWIDDDDYSPFVVPVTPASAPASVPIDAPLFPTHVTDAHRADLPVTFLQDIPPPRPGEGSSRQPFGHVPFMLGGDQFVPPISHHTFVPPVASSAIPSYAPSSEPFLWTSPPIMPPSDPYHPYHMGYSTEDILRSFMIQQEALTRRVQELERVQRPPCQCPTHPAVETSGNISQNNGNNNLPHGNIK